MLIFMNVPKKGEGPTQFTIVRTRRLQGVSREQIERELSHLLDGKDFETGLGNLDEDDPHEPRDD